MNWFWFLLCMLFAFVAGVGCHQYVILSQNTKEETERIVQESEYFADWYRCSKRIRKALDIAWHYGQNSEANHKAWVIDQMVRALCGDSYQDWINDFEEPLSDDSDLHYEWDCGIKP